MTAKTKASGNIDDGANEATEARANAAGLYDPAADVEGGEEDAPEMSVDGDRAFRAKADSVDADGDDGEEEGTSTGGTNDETEGNDAEWRDEEMDKDVPNDGGDDEDGASHDESNDERADADAKGDRPAAEGLPDGWTLRRVPRDKDPSRSDMRWFSPTMSYRFNTLLQVRRFLACLEGAGGNEVVAYGYYSTKKDKKQQKDRSESPAVDDVVAQTCDETNSKGEEREGGSLPDTSGDERAHAATDEDEEEAEGGAEELWDLKMVLTAKEILKPRPMPCMGDECDLVACCIWSSNLDPETPWCSCLDCQAEYFGGWPENADDIPIKVLDDERRIAMTEKCTLEDHPAMPNLPSRARGAEGGESSDDADADANAAVLKENVSGKNDESPSDDDEQGDGVLWELTKIYNEKDLRRAKPTMCSGEECDLVACSRWESNEGGKWFSCLDCQESDYGGWPVKDELPLDFLSEESRRLIAEKCSAEESPTMPDLPTSMALLSTADADGNENSGRACAITPPPSHNRAVAENQSEVVVGAVHVKDHTKEREVGVTPSPMPPKGASNKAAARKSIDAAPTAKNPAVEKPKVMSKSAIEAHRKWQAEAEKLGGPDARVVVSKPDAKKLIFDKLHNEFAPMNIDGVFKKLKAVVPSIVLKSCLDEMVDKHMSNPFTEGSDDDDDEDDSKPPKKKTSKKPADDSDEYSGSLKLKEGRNVQNNLYYVDHTKLSNEGNGLLPEVRNELLCDMQKSKTEFDQLARQLKTVTAEAVQLESEPKNELLILEVADLEKKIGQMNDSLEESRHHVSNEKHAQKVKKEIENMASVWRKRKRQCIEFISNMEESTEGTISLKKCLNGEGALEIDSDEAAIKAAIAFAHRKRPKVNRGSLTGGGKRGGESSGVRPDENFIGVQLSAQGRPERVFAKCPEE